jgi:hypothetical protein
MSLLKMFTDLTQAVQEMTHKDMVVFGEIVRIMEQQGYPCIGFHAAEGYQSGRFLIEGPVLFALTVALDKKIAGKGLLSLTAEVRNKLADPDDMIAMLKTDLSNLAKIPLLGQIKVNHEYNTIYAKTTTLASISSYLESKGVVDAARLRADLLEIVVRLEETLRPFKKG